MNLFNYVNGNQPSILGGAKVYVDNTLCGTIPQDPTKNDLLSVTCVDSNNNPYPTGISGRIIKI